MSTLTRLMAMILVLAVILASAAPAATQAKPPRDPSMIQRKLMSSADLQRQALQSLGDRGQRILLCMADQSMTV